MAGNLNFPQITVPMVDMTTGQITREWLLFMVNLFNNIGQTNNYSVEDVFTLEDFQIRQVPNNGSDISTEDGLLSAEFAARTFVESENGENALLASEFRKNPDLYELFRRLTSRTISASATIYPSDYYVRIDTTSSNVSATLPSSAEMIEQDLTFTKITSQNIAYLVPQGSDKIIGESLIEITEQWTSLTLRGKSGGYDII